MSTYYGYSRVSTREQSEHSLENQLKYLKVQSNKFKASFKGYKEKKSGKDGNRPVLSTIIADLIEGDILGVYDNSRLGRNTAENLKIVSEIESKGAILQVNGKVIDINNPNDKLTLTIESAVSTYQRENQNLKSRIGIESVKENGEWIFTSRLYGYDCAGTKRNPIINIIESEAKVIKYIYDEYCNGESTNQIAINLNRQGIRTRDSHKWVPSCIRRYILKPIYMGYYKLTAVGNGDGRRQENVTFEKEKLIKSKYYEPIISEELWWNCYNSYRTLKRSHQRQFKYRYSHYELSSVIRCAHCGSTYIHSFSKETNKIHSYYTANHCIKGCPQKRRGFVVDIFEPLFQNLFYISYLWQDDVEAYLNSIKYEFKVDNSALSNEYERLELLIKETSIKIENLYKAVESGLNIDKIVPRINAMERDKETMEDRLRELMLKQISKEEELAYIVEDYSDGAILRFIQGNTEYRRSMYLQTFDVLCRDDQIEVEYVTGLKIVIPIFRNSRWNMQRKFELKVVRGDKYNSTLLFDTENETFTIQESNRLKKANLDILLKNLEEKIELGNSVKT